MSGKKRKYLYPVPEAVDGRQWAVRGGTPSTNMRDREMMVPTDDSAASTYLRAHETVHARISPRTLAIEAAKKHGISIYAMQSCEDLRVHDFMSERGIPLPGVMPDGEAKRMVEHFKNDARLLGSMLVASANTGDWDAVRDAVRGVEGGEAILQAVERVLDYYKANLEWLATEGKDGKADTARVRRAVGSRRGFEKITVRTAKVFDLLFPTQQPPDPTTTDFMRRGRHASAHKPVPWGKLEGIIKARMTAPRRGSLRSVTKTFREEGVVPVAPYRIILDGRIFTRKKRGKGGTVLVDLSGSMSLDSEDIERIIAAAPGSTVAAYAGHCEGGKIVIAAERGRMASAAEIKRCVPWGGNVIDGPALKWLATQPAPRIWVCDGGVTGVGDRGALNLSMEAAAICQSASIRRVDEASMAAALLGQK